MSIQMKPFIVLIHKPQTNGKHTICVEQNGRVIYMIEGTGYVKRGGAIPSPHDKMP